MLMDGTILYDSWQEEPVQFEYGKRFDTQGLVEGVAMMKEGQMAHLIVPSSIAFGEYGRQGLIEPYSTLLYDVELLDIKTKDEIKKETIRQLAMNKKESDAFLAKNAEVEGVVVLPSGLQYKVLEKGDGTESPSASSRVKVHYKGTLIDGRTFDSSYDRGKPAEFAVNGVIKGWTEALQLMKPGDKWQLFIPSDLAYGNNPRPGGIIEPNMALIFDVELLEIVK
jgi:FKBP-type peptidyl-prolyl cis-trans isomerase